jgi:hypothetical protein
LWEIILWWQCLLGLHAHMVSIYVLWWIGNEITKKNSAWIFKIGTVLP